MSPDEQLVVDEQTAPVTEAFPVVPPVDSITVLDFEWDAESFAIGYQLAVETAAAVAS